MRVLVMRMSSLGDLILSTSFLETLPERIEVDWVISSEFEFVLRGHPRIRRLWVYDKKTGLTGWFSILRQISEQSYDARVDLHRTLRTWIARVWFFLSDLRARRRGRGVVISKERVRTLGLLFLKRRSAAAFPPTPYWIRFGKAAREAIGDESVPLKKPSYLPVLRQSALSAPDVLHQRNLVKGEFYCLMPASRWRTKEWSPAQFYELVLTLQKKGLRPVLLGREKDPACSQLRSLLETDKIPYFSALQEADFRVTAILIQNAAFFVGCDTGLSHLSEAVGCRTNVIFGPTRPELGFGPCQEGSRAISLPIGCAPCSKDGRHCHRFWYPYECMKRLEPSAVEKALSPW